MPGIFLGPSLPPGGGITGPVRGVQAMRWTGWDGSEWDLLGEDSGLFLDGAVRGMGMPEVDHFRSESPAVAGSRWRGHRVPQREAFWPLFLYSDGSSQDWVEFDRAFWKTMFPDKTGVWTVVQPGGQARTLRLRFEDDGGHSYDFDPSIRGWEFYTITLVAEDPYWQGQPVTKDWVSISPPTFFPGPPWNIASSHTTASADLSNPGDVESWPVWTLHAPFTAAEVGLSGQTVTVPFAMSSGSLTIDTDPRVQTAVTNLGVDRTPELGSAGFAPVPPGIAVPLTLSLTGAGSVSVALPTRYYKAW